MIIAMKYTAKKFKLPNLKDISKKTIDEHLKLYQGYVKNVNKIHQLIANKAEHNDYALKEAQRRLGFEFGGMRNHEYYFGALEGSPQAPNKDSLLTLQINDQFGSFKAWKKLFTATIASQRGIGWAILGYDSQKKQLLNYWVDEQHLGHLTGVTPLLALDMWEHSYCMDYAPSEKKKYVEAYFKNLNWSVIETWFEEVVK